MKHIVTSCLVLASLLASASPKTAAIVREAEKLNWTPEQLSRLESLCDDYERASDALIEYQNLMGLKAKTQKKTTINADVVDPTIRKIQQQAKKYQNRFEVLCMTQKKWGPSTNLLARAARQSMQSRLDETRAERDAAKVYEKQVKDLQKAAKKDGKNLDKLRKDIEKYRDKAETYGFRETCERLLNMLPLPNEAEK